MNTLTKKQSVQVAEMVWWSVLQSGAKKMPVVDTDGRFKTKNKKHDAKIAKKPNMVFYNVNKLYKNVDNL